MCHICLKNLQLCGWLVRSDLTGRRRGETWRSRKNGCNRQLSFMRQRHTQSPKLSRTSASRLKQNACRCLASWWRWQCLQYIDISMVEEAIRLPTKNTDGQMIQRQKWYWQTSFRMQHMVFLLPMAESHCCEKSCNSWQLPTLHFSLAGHARYWFEHWAERQSIGESVWAMRLENERMAYQSWEHHAIFSIIRKMVHHLVDLRCTAALSKVFHKYLTAAIKSGYASVQVKDAHRKMNKCWTTFLMCSSWELRSKSDL